MAHLRDTRPAQELRYAPMARRVRACFADRTLADSRRPALVWEPGRPVPLYAFPREDVRADMLDRSSQLPARAHAIREAWTVSTPERAAESAAWSYDDDDLADHIVLEWNAMDRWLEEDEEVFVHPRDPFHRVEVRASSRWVKIEALGELLAESSRPLLLFETGLPTRLYLPAEDVRDELLVASETRSLCPYKGEATYWSARVAGQTLEDVVWSYPEPLAEITRIRGLLAFFDEHVDVTIDGEAQEPPVTPWSRPPRG